MAGAKDLLQKYNTKRTTASQALSRIRSGSRVFLGSACAEPRYLLGELVSMGGVTGRLDDVEIVHNLSIGDTPHTANQFDRSFRHNSFFVGKGVRQAVFEGAADYTPIFLSEIPALLRKGRMHLDAALVQVSPPDHHGFCSLGVSVDINLAAVEAAEYVVAQINPRMPRTMGRSFIHLDQIDAIVEFEEPLIEVPPTDPDTVARAIAKHISRIVENGSTIQVGIGAIPNAVLQCLGDKKDLGVHTEMFTDGIIDLIENGVINNSRKTFHEGKVVAAFCIGTQRLFDYVNNNPMFEFYPTDYTSSVLNIARNHKMVAINTALEVDITGQVCADSIGHRIYSGIGGQADFIRGAALAPDGTSIIALPSTAKNGTVSRIVPQLSPGAGVVTTRGDVHYIATEYGVAYLHGKSLRERAMSLIAIAHPKFRDELTAKAKEWHYLFEDQIIPEMAVYPVEVEHEYLADSTKLFIRPVKPSDERKFQEYLYDLSERSIYLRFFQKLKAFHRDVAQEVVAVDYHQRMGIIATAGTADAERIVAAAHWILDPNENMAEVAFSVADELQSQGIGHYLCHLLVILAREQRIKGFTASVLAENLSMRRILEHEAKTIGAPMRSLFEDGIFEITVLLTERDDNQRID